MLSMTNAFEDRYVAVYEEEAAEIGGGIYRNPQTGIYAAGYVSNIVYATEC